LHTCCKHQTLDDIIAVEPIFNELCKKKGEKLPFTQLGALADEALEKGWIEAEDAELMKRAEAGRLRTINVDDFDHDELIAATSQQAKKTTRKTKKAA
jgi:acyl-CoA dehydrogenase